MKHFVGIDLGGTNIKAGVVDENGKIIKKDSIKTHAQRDQMAIAKDMGLLAAKVISDAGLKPEDIDSIGIGSPGTPDNDAGVLIYANNLPFNNLPLRKAIREVVDLPVYIDNDANVAALAETVAGGAQGTQHSVTLTLGTGLGCGVVINERIYSGFNNAGSELGHMVIKTGGHLCTCGRKGCFETYGTATAIIRDTEKAAKDHPESILGKLIEENGGRADGRTAFIGMRQGDQVSASVVEHFIEMLAEGLANVINIFMPEVILIGGGVCNEGDPLLLPLREKALAKTYLADGVPKTKIRLAQMGNDAGIVGAAMMGRNCLTDGLAG